MTRPVRFARLAGALGLAVALAFMLYEGLDHRAALADWRPGWTMAALLGGLALVYGAALFLLAENWHRIVALYGTEPRNRTWPSYTTTLIARYLPGNVAHILARAAWLRTGPLGKADLARASALELIVTPLGAGLVLVLLAPALPGSVLPSGWDAAVLLLGVPTLGLGTALAIRWLQPPQARTAWTPLLGPLLLSMLFMAALGAIFAAISGSIAGTGPAFAMAVGLVGWLVGYVTPGAPGGLGTREAAITLLLSTTVPPEAAIITALAFRLVTMLGELACFFTGVLARPRRLGAPAQTG
ncbi:lysylphosphatidylglycerol synthase domain-containing protein [Palleronia abyssalis]|uniref:Inner membrane protein YbhN n=1 Tax=Palleronia abyssalis TaxID=1501240 RepID=A0A2R8BZD2_9RHOB|nr:lysylphosphatidylglycerol synthase domain-containing protein [Palleronia abyssalis]SPJ25518.1 hypothetical protein PAA8504_03369 [Palleronia abyssalis]